MHASTPPLVKFPAHNIVEVIEDPKILLHSCSDIHGTFTECNLFGFGRLNPSRPHPLTVNMVLLLKLTSEADGNTTDLALDIPESLNWSTISMMATSKPCSLGFLSRRTFMILKA